MITCLFCKGIAIMVSDFIFEKNGYLRLTEEDYERQNQILRIISAKCKSLYRGIVHGF